MTRGVGPRIQEARVYAIVTSPTYKMIGIQYPAISDNQSFYSLKIASGRVTRKWSARTGRNWLQFGMIADPKWTLSNVTWKEENVIKRYLWRHSVWAMTFVALNRFASCIRNVNISLLVRLVLFFKVSVPSSVCTFFMHCYSFSFFVQIILSYA